MKKRKLTSRGKNKEATTEKGRRRSAVAERTRGAKAKADADAAIKATPPHTPAPGVKMFQNNNVVNCDTNGLEPGGGSIAVYPSGPCVLEKHCLAPTGAVVVQCPGCSSDIHPECGRFLTRFEGSKINGNMKWYKPDSVVCLSCDPSSNGTFYVVKDVSSSEDEDEDEVEEKLEGDEECREGEEEDGDDTEEDGTTLVEDGTTPVSKITQSHFAAVDNLQPTNQGEGRDGEIVVTPGSNKCSYRKCVQKTAGTPSALLKCSNLKCLKKIHSACFSEFMKGSKLTFGLKEGVICCATVRCCTKFRSSGAERTRWDSDGPNGPDTLPNSQSILLDWWTTGDNYHLYRGGTDCDGKTSSRKKSDVWNELADVIRSCGIIVERTPHQIGIKLCKMEGEYKKASDWLNGSGQGLLDEGGDIEDKVRKICPFYYDIEAVMKDRPNVNPLCVGEAGVGADSSEEEDNNNGDNDNNDGGNDGDGDFVASGTEGTDDNTSVHIESTPTTDSQKRKAAVIRSPMNVNKKRKTTTMNTVTSSILDGIKDAIKEKDEKRVSWKLKEMEESRKMKEAEIQETRKFKEAEHLLKEREVLAKEAEVAVHKLKVEGELAKMQSEAELIQEQKKAVMQDRMKKLLMDRKELLELGISLEEVNLMLPLK